MVEAERLLGGRVAGAGVPDIISRATQALKRAAELRDKAPDRQVRRQGERAVKAIVDAVQDAREFGKDAWKALGQGAEDLWRDVQAHVLGPVIVLALLYLASKG